MKSSKVNAGDWIKVGETGIDAYVFHVHSEDEISAGYYQNKEKAIREDFVWDGQRWQFKTMMPCGLYLRGHDATIVKNGPYFNKPFK
ncbi:hypothetical protein JF50_13185 [Pseudoalteromonas luteoviolacea]|uniref:Uncharacterized protein n=1 Tax=Pseudoalteromonas luteoviolacea TaxID=43657 RepID=A0A0C1Q7Y4_9GAMM|nr:hypothetical protein [Pseudoalteromonas luteoviolacea]KID56846.1 hypothetical protein JF50_13185 [Pseudoalteromonas luteoviolacea]